MARRVVSLLRTPPAVLRTSDPVFEANAYAVAEDLDLTVVLRGAGAEHVLAGVQTRAVDVGGELLPTASTAQDLHGLLESGVAVLVVASDLARGGMTQEDLVDGVRVVDDAALAAILRDAEAVLTW